MAIDSRRQIMRVEKLMTREVKSCRQEDSLARAAQLMWEGDCGFLPVCAADGANRVAGIITDRDICMAALFQGRPLADLRVADVMNRQVQVCLPSDTLADAERTMATARVRRLPVVDKQGSLLGMITLADLAREAEREQTLQSPQVRGSEISVTLASICQPPRHDLAA
jgi:CBS domain-containing protein